MVVCSFPPSSLSSYCLLAADTGDIKGILVGLFEGEPIVPPHIVDRLSKYDDELTSYDLFLSHQSVALVIS